MTPRHAAGAPPATRQLAPGFAANFAIWDAEHPVEMVYEPAQSALASRLTPEEAWAGSDAPCRAGAGAPASHGQLAPGFVANFAIWDAEHPVEMVYEPLFKESCNDAVASYASQSLAGTRRQRGSANALRLFQTIVRAERFAPQEMPGDIALLGFACDEGVRRNKGAYRGSGRPGDPAGRWPIWPAIRVMTAAWIWAPSASTASS